MDRNTIRKEIIALVSSIKSQSDALANEKYPSQLELELFFHKIEKLYQKSIVFNHLSLFDGFEEADALGQPAPVAQGTLMKKEIIPDVIAQAPPVYQEEKVAGTVSTPPSAEVNEPVAPPEKTVEIKPEKKQERPVAIPTQKSILPDLKAAIGINDKFQFTNELFKGNMQEFNIAIEQLNASETKESAVDYLGSLQRLYDWDQENETVKRLMNIIDRRYN